MATIKEKSKIKNNVIIELRDKNNILKDRILIHNSITAMGNYSLASQLLPVPDIAKPGYIELGIGGGGSVLLDEYIEGSRIALSSIERINNSVIMIGYWTTNVTTVTITEAGIFNSVDENSSDMLLYTTFRGINKLTSDSLLITWIWEFN